jgi:hypothetical protein
MLPSSRTIEFNWCNTFGITYINVKPVKTKNLKKNGFDLLPCCLLQEGLDSTGATDTSTSNNYPNKNIKKLFRLLPSRLLQEGLDSTGEIHSASHTSTSNTSHNKKIKKNVSTYFHAVSFKRNWIKLAQRIHQRQTQVQHTKNETVEPYLHVTPYAK